MNLQAFLYRIMGYKTLQELLKEQNEGKRTSIDRKTLRNAHKLSLALMPKNTYFPMGGEIFETLTDIEVTYLTHFTASYRGGDNSMLLKGEKVIIMETSKGKGLSYYCRPINYEEVEKRMIPKKEREDPKYNGYILSVDTIVLNRSFKRCSLENTH